MLFRSVFTISLIFSHGQRAVGKESLSFVFTLGRSSLVLAQIHVTQACVVEQSNPKFDLWTHRRFRSIRVAGSSPDCLPTRESRVEYMIHFFLNLQCFFFHSSFHPPVGGPAPSSEASSALVAPGTTSGECISPNPNHRIGLTQHGLSLGNDVWVVRSPTIAVAKNRDEWFWRLLVHSTRAWANSSLT